jgi:hypothetical protein
MTNSNDVQTAATVAAEAPAKKRRARKAAAFLVTRPPSKKAKGKVLPVTTRKLRSVADRRAMAAEMLALPENKLPGNSARVLKQIMESESGATGYELTRVNGYAHPARKAKLAQMAKMFGFRLKVVERTTEDGSPRYKFV